MMNTKIEDEPLRTEFKLGHEHTRLGSIPLGWQRFEFEKIALKSKVKHNPQKKGQLDLPCVELEHIESETGRLLGTSWTHQLASVKNYFDAESVLFGKLRPYLRKYLLPGFEGACSSEIWVFKPSKLVKVEYLYLMIQTHRFAQASSVTSGTKMPRSDWQFIREVPFNLPPLPEQRKIAQILSTWDRAIDRLQKLIAKKQERKKGLMQVLLSGKKRFSTFETNNTVKDSKIGQLPEEWRIIQLFEMGKVLSGLTYSPSDIRDKGLLVLRSSNIQAGRLKFDDNVFVDNSDCRFNPVKEGDILICVRNGSKRLIGKNTKITSEIEGSAFGAFMMIFRSEFNEYVYQLFQTDYFNKEIQKNLGATINSINGSHLRKFMFPFPKLLEEQQKIASVLSAADKEIEKLEIQLEKLQEQKKGLMQKLLTGEVRVLNMK